MLMWAYLQWWYGAGWRSTGTKIAVRQRSLYASFSVPILLATLFAPWRRIVSGSDGSLPQILRASIDNLVSRSIGLAVRCFALVAAAVLMAGNLILGGLIVLVWPLLPVVAIGLVIWGVVA